MASKSGETNLLMSSRVRRNQYIIHSHAETKLITRTELSKVVLGEFQTKTCVLNIRAATYSQAILILRGGKLTWVLGLLAN